MKPRRITCQRKNRERRLVVLLGMAFALLVSVMVLPAAAKAPLSNDLTELNLEELMAIEVTSVSKKSQPVSQTASAIFVITQEDIRRSGANSIPEALRMAPGLHVARIDSQKWSVTSRGFSGRFADDLLVLIDGRTVYSPLVAGVFWEVQDLPLEDIDRIEIIRGPGGTLWGANAVNGAVHIITKKAKETPGALVTVGGGTEERAFTTLRYGGTIGNSVSYRLYGKGFERDRTVSANGSHDDWRMGRTGGRLDWDAGAQDSVTLQGDYYQGQAGQQTSFPTMIGPSFSTSAVEDLRMSGGNMLGRWKHTFGQQHDFTAQFYYDKTRRDELSFKEIRNTVDIDLQHRFPLPLGQDIVWGIGYRISGDHLRNSESLSFDPAERRLRTFSMFLQDEIKLFQEKVRLTVGAKYLKNTFTGGLIQPNIRLLYNPSPDQTIWATVTRSNRIPSRFERDGRQTIAGTPTEFVDLQGNPAAQSETLWGYELGYRAQLDSTLSFDTAVFYNRYKHSSGEQEISDSLEQIHTTVTTHTYGGELAGEWRMLSWWRLRPAFSYLHIRRSAPEGIEFESGEDPAHQASLRSLMNLTDTIEVDTTFRFVDRLPGIGVSNYQNVDIRLGWRPSSGLEISLVGHNLLENRHAEFKPEFITTAASQIQRGVFGKVTWRF
ncbi:MAG: TonB-dependent receptor [Nitrospira sp. CG24A]|nr:MAG: TonB-dependent receptor [Nitrospira sp. CG24A]